MFRNTTCSLSFYCTRALRVIHGDEFKVDRGKEYSQELCLIRNKPNWLFFQEVKNTPSSGVVVLLPDNISQLLQ